MRFLRFILITAIVLTGLAGLSLVLLLEERPLVESQDLPGAESVRRARNLVSFIKYSFRRSNRTHRLYVSETDLNGLVSFVGRGLKPISGRAELRHDKVSLLATVRFPPTPFGRFVNVGLSILPSTEGLRVDRLKIGPLDIPGRIALPLIVFAADTIVGADVAGMLAGAVRSVETRGKMLRVAYRFEGDTVAVMKSRVKTAIREAAPMGDAEIVRVYYEKLADIGAREDTRMDGPLGHYLTPLFDFARQRSNSSDPAAENRAAILALAMYCGTLAFENLIGEVRRGAYRRHWPRCRRTTLAGRHDLMLHFVYSAALEIAADSGLAFAAGEFKEVLDSARGGSGFSFADLAADRAGVRFAETALDSAAGARHLQATIAGSAEEAAFFPEIAGLAEGLSEDAFRRIYRSLEDPAYRTAVAELDARIGELPAYRATD